MSKITRAYLAGVATVLLPLLAFLLLVQDVSTDVSFQSSDGQWADHERPADGRGFAAVLMNFELYRLQCDAPDAELQRTTPTPRWYTLRFWLEDRSRPEWKLPYAEALPYMESGDYPPAYMQHCANLPASPEMFEAAAARSRERVSMLSAQEHRE